MRTLADLCADLQRCNAAIDRSWAKIVKMDVEFGDVPWPMLLEHTGLQFDCDEAEVAFAEAAAEEDGR